MNYMRPVPKLIDPGLLGKVNKVNIVKQSQNNFILEWIVNTIYPYFRDNFFFTIVVISLVCYLLYRYLENIKKKNRIIQNIDEEKPINVAATKPINYDGKKDSEKFKNYKLNSSQLSQLSEISGLSEMTNLSSPKNIVFEKDLERDLQIGNTNQELRELPPELVRQRILLDQRNINAPNQMGDIANEQINRPLLSPNMPMNILQQNMNQYKAVNQGCSSYKPPATIEPTAGNAFSDNFVMF